MSKSPLAKEVTFAACWPDRRWSATHNYAKGVPCGSAALNTGVARYWRTLGRCRTMHFDAAGHKGGAVQHMIRAACPMKVAGFGRDPEQALVSGLEFSWHEASRVVVATSSQVRALVETAAPRSRSCRRVESLRYVLVRRNLAWILPPSACPATMPAHRSKLHVARNSPTRSTRSTSRQVQDNGVPSFNATSGRLFHWAARSPNKPHQDVYGHHHSHGQGHFT